MQHNPGSQCSTHLACKLPICVGAKYTHLLHTYFHSTEGKEQATIVIEQSHIVHFENMLKICPK